MMAWGGAGGTIVGCVYGFLLLAFGGNASLSTVGACVGLVLGGLTGLGVGLFDGLVLTALIYLTSHRIVARTGTRIILYIVSIGVMTLGALLGFGFFTASLGVTSQGWIVYTLIPTLLAVVIAWKASAEVVTWVRKSIA
jgi:hypothetical protein